MARWIELEKKWENRKPKWWSWCNLWHRWFDWYSQNSPWWANYKYPKNICRRCKIWWKDEEVRSN